MLILLVGLHRFTQPGGICRYTANLFSSLKRVDSLRVMLVLGEWQRGYYKQALKLNVDDPDIVWVALKRPALGRYGWYLRGVPKLARELGASVVHAAFPMPLVKRWIPCPIVTTMHDLYAYDAPESIGFPNILLNKIVLRQSIRSSDTIISISKCARGSLRKWFPQLEERMPLPVIYQDVGPRASEGENTASTMTGRADKFLLCVAQHRKHKNLDLVIEAYYKAIGMGVIEANTHLVIVGSEGPETSYLKSIVEGRSGVRFLNAIPDEELVGLYKTCEALICASSIEGFCLPVAEALSFSRKVVCSDIPILREVAGDQGSYFALEPRSPNALVKAIEQSLKSSRQTVLGAALREPNTGGLTSRVYRYVVKGDSSAELMLECGSVGQNNV